MTATRTRTGAFALLLAVCACEHVPALEQDGGPGPIDECTDLPELQLEISPAHVRSGEVATLQASGGSGRYRFSADGDPANGELREDRFIAGMTAGSTTVRVSDDCGASAEATLKVSSTFEVEPVRAVIAPGTRIQIRTGGALGEPRFDAQALGSEGSLSDRGEYVAGSREGTDLITVADPVSGDEVLLQYRVAEGAQLTAATARIALPAGSEVTLVARDGTGVVHWVLEEGPGLVDEASGLFRAPPGVSGRAEITLTDEFTLQTAAVTVQILEELSGSDRPHGRLTDIANLVTGDFDGDGISDVALGVPESDLQRPTGGAVFVFRGAAEGLPSEPTWVLLGDTDTANLGAMLVAGDLDGDGRDELAVSEPGADVTFSDSGAVLLYTFDASGPELLRPPLTGLGRGNFGASLAIADVDGDGDADLIVGSPGADLAPSGKLRERGVVDVFLLEKGEPISDLPSLRIGGSDLAPDGTFQESPGLKFGRALAVADFNADGHLDLASLGAVSNSLLGGHAVASVQVAIAVHFGRAEGLPLLAAPDLMILPTDSSDPSQGAFRLTALPAAEGGDHPHPARLLLTGDRLDSPDLTASGGAKGGGDSGGAYLFELAGQPLRELDGAAPKQLGKDDAFAQLWGDSAQMAVGRSAAVSDLNADGLLELVLGAPNASGREMQDGKEVSVPQAGKLLVFPYSELERGARLNRARDSRVGAQSDSLGVAVRDFTKPGESTRGLLAYAARATTGQGDFTGRLDAYTGGGALTAFAQRSAEIPARLAAQQRGAAVALGVVKDRLHAIVGVPGFAGAGKKLDGNELGAGQALLYTPGSDTPPSVLHEGAAVRYESSGRPAFGGKQIGIDVAFSDWNGDGLLDLVIAAPTLATPTATDTDYARLDPACVTDPAQANGGVLIYFAREDGTFVDGAHVTAVSAIPGCMPADEATCQRKELARGGLAGGFDFDGDGTDDLVLARANGLEVFAGRAADDASLGKPSLVCNPLFSLPAMAQSIFTPVALGDLDADGCDEVAARYADNARSGTLIVFGFAARGGGCGGHNQPAWLRVSGDADKGLSNIQLGVAVARAGRLLGDERDFVAISAALFPFDARPQPAVLLYELSALAAKRPARGEALVGALNDGLEPIPLVYRDRAPGFGRSLVGGLDLDGDELPDLVVSAPGASINGDGAGAVFVFRGGPALQGRIDPWWTVVGDGRERAGLGLDLSAVAATEHTPAMIAIGAPLSYRSGTANGTAWLLPL